MDKPIHALIMGVTMHYSQYLVLTSKIFYKRRMQGDLYKFVNKKNIFYFATIVLVYGLVMSSLAFLPKLDIKFKNNYNYPFGWTDATFLFRIFTLEV